MIDHFVLDAMNLREGYVIAISTDKWTGEALYVRHDKEYVEVIAGKPRKFKINELRRVVTKLRQTTAEAQTELASRKSELIQCKAAVRAAEDAVAQARDNLNSVITRRQWLGLKRGDDINVKSDEYWYCGVYFRHDNERLVLFVDGEKLSMQISEITKIRRNPIRMETVERMNLRDRDWVSISTDEWSASAMVGRYNDVGIEVIANGRKRWVKFVDISRLVKDDFQSKIRTPPGDTSAR